MWLLSVQTALVWMAAPIYICTVRWGFATLTCLHKHTLSPLRCWWETEHIEIKQMYSHILCCPRSLRNENNQRCTHTLTHNATHSFAKGLPHARSKHWHNRTKPPTSVGLSPFCRTIRLPLQFMYVCVFINVFTCTCLHMWVYCNLVH